MNAGLYQVDDLVVHLDIEGRPGFDDLDSGTHLPCIGNPGAGFDSVSLRFITRRDAAGGLRQHRSDPDGLASQMRLGVLLRGRKIAVHIDEKGA